MDGECAAKMVQNTLPGCNPAVTSSAFRGSTHATIGNPLAQNRELGISGTNSRFLNAAIAGKMISGMDQFLGQLLK
jgi:hypothetical protein